MGKKARVLYTLCSDPEMAGRVVEALSKAGIEAKNLAVLSSEPFEEFEFFRRDHYTPMPWISACGGLIGGITGYVFAGFTQEAYPLPTGGMPLAPHWTNGIITYEMTMLGAILFTLFTLLLTARLPNWRKQLYDPAISNGMILVGAVNPSDAMRIEVDKVLRQAGGPVKEFES